MADWKINFWKLNVYVDRSNEICVDMNNSIWELDGSNNVWHRKKSPTIKLGYQVCLLEQDNSITEVSDGLNRPVGGIKIEDGAILFSNKHFLRIKGVVPPEKPAPSEEATPPEELVPPEVLKSKVPKIEIIEQTSGKVELLSGRNIHVEVTFDANNPEIIENNEKRMPLFYLEQGLTIDDKKYVISLGEIHTETVSEIVNKVEKTDNIRHVYWKISGNEQINTGDFRMCEPTEYTLTINQDYDRFRDIDDTEPPYFEFLADSVPLPMQKQEEGKDFKRAHPFHLSERLLYIGYDPDSKATFEGSIRSLLFDPNSSCENC